MKTKGYS